MIIFFAGDGEHAENSNKLKKRKNKKNWGTLMSYFMIKAKDNRGSTRFKKLIDRIK